MYPAFSCFTDSPPGPPLGMANKNQLNALWDDDDKYIYVGRPSIFGNPFNLRQYTRSQAIDLFKDYALNSKVIIDNIHQLSGKILVCSCQPLPCHADFYIKY